MHDDKVLSGYKKPPQHSRFAKGKSGNPKGRPRKKLKDAGEILDRELPLEFNGEMVNVPITEAAMLSLYRSALKGDERAAQAFLKHFDKLEIKDAPPEPIEPIIGMLVVPQFCDTLLIALGAIKKRTWQVSELGQQVDRTTYQMELWVLEEALKRNKLKKTTAADIDRVAKCSVDPVRAAAVLARAGYSGTPPPAHLRSEAEQPSNRAAA